MRGKAAALVLAVVAAGCGADCPLSAAIELTIVPAPAVDPAAIAKVRLVLSVNGAPARTLDFVPPHVLAAPSSVLLQPDSTPADRYSISVTVEAIDTAGNIVEIGGTGGEVLANGCNRLQAVLAALQVPDAGPGSADLTCIGPDEDSDGRPNMCDLCPADYDPVPVDTDGDGLPDACDPDPQRAGNRALYFEPFDTVSGHWSGGFPIAGSYLNLNTPNVAVASSNGTDSLPAGVRAQTILFSPLYYAAQPSSSMGIFVGDSNTFGAATGILCTINFYNQTRVGTLEVNRVNAGQIQPPTQASFPFGNNVVYRLRLTQNGSTWSCDADANGIPPGSLAVAGPLPGGPQYMSLFAANLEAHFHSVVAETKLP